MSLRSKLQKLLQKLAVEEEEAEAEVEAATGKKKASDRLRQHFHFWVFASVASVLCQAGRTWTRWETKTAEGTAAWATRPTRREQQPLLR